MFSACDAKVKYFYDNDLIRVSLTKAKAELPW